jgi:hypothetical protein
VSHHTAAPALAPVIEQRTPTVQAPGRRGGYRPRLRTNGRDRAVRVDPPELGDRLGYAWCSGRYVTASLKSGPWKTFLVLSTFFHQGPGGHPYVSIGRLAQDSHQGTATVRRHLRKLEAFGWVVTTELGGRQHKPRCGGPRRCSCPGLANHYGITLAGWQALRGGLHRPPGVQELPDQEAPPARQPSPELRNHNDCPIAPATQAQEMEAPAALTTSAPAALEKAAAAAPPPATPAQPARPPRSTVLERQRRAETHGAKPAPTARAVSLGDDAPPAAVVNAAATHPSVAGFTGRVVTLLVPKSFAPDTSSPLPEAVQFALWDARRRMQSAPDRRPKRAPVALAVTERDEESWRARLRRLGLLEDAPAVPAVRRIRTPGDDDS